MDIPGQLESLCSRAFLAIRYENINADDCLGLAAAQLPEADRETVLRFLDRVASGEGANSILVSSVQKWADRFGVEMEGDVVKWLLSARTALAMKANNS